MTGRFIAVVGPSGVGKDSVMTAMAKAEPRLARARRMITRPSDAGGEEFDGVDERTFDQMLAEEAFALHWGAHGLRYGIPKQVDCILGSGTDVLANLSRRMLGDAQRRFGRTAVLALSATPETLRARLVARGRETADQIDQRVAVAQYALPSGIVAVNIDNSGPLDQTVARALTALYPDRG